MENDWEKGRGATRPKSGILRLRSGRIGRWFLSFTLFQQFAIACTLVLGLTMAGLGSWISERISTGVLKRSAEVGALYMESILEPNVQSLASQGHLSDLEIAKLDAITSSHALRRHVLSVKVWLPDGTVVYSSEKALIGRKFETTEIEPALKGEVNGYLSELEEDENAFERKLSVPLYEIYAPIYLTGTREIIAVGEFYENAERLSNELVDAAKDNWLVVGTSSLGMLLVLFAIVYRGSGQIDRQRAKLKIRFRQQLKLHRSNEKMQANMQEALRETARLDHQIQRRVGAELHDGPAQLIAFVLLRLDEIEDALDARSPARRVLVSLRQAASDALSELRAISSGLFLPFLDGNRTLNQMTGGIIEAHRRRAGMNVEYFHFGLPDVCPPDICQCVARVTQEALNNAHKHAPGSHQWVTLSCTDDVLTLGIRDNGPGLRAEPAGEGEDRRLGLKGIKYRVEAVGGTVDIRSVPGQGTEVICVIPLAVIP